MVSRNRPVSRIACSISGATKIQWVRVLENYSPNLILRVILPRWILRTPRHPFGLCHPTQPYKGEHISESRPKCKRRTSINRIFSINYTNTPGFPAIATHPPLNGRSAVVCQRSETRRKSRKPRWLASCSIGCWSWVDLSPTRSTKRGLHGGSAGSTRFVQPPHKALFRQMASYRTFPPTDSD